MLKDLLSRLTGPATTDPLPIEDAQTALIALLIRAAREDGHFDTDERKTIEGIARARFGGDIAALMANATAFEKDAGDTVRITRLIKDSVPYEDRVGVIEALWQVVLADNDRSDEEDAFLRLTASLLGVTDMESGLARQRVATAAGGAKPIR